MATGRKRTTKPNDGFHVSMRGLSVSVGRAAVVIIASGVAAILYAIARAH